MNLICEAYSRSTFAKINYHCVMSIVYSAFHFSGFRLFKAYTKQLLFSISLVFSSTVCAQVTVGFQGGEPGDPWGFTSTGASALSLSEATQSPNKVTGTTSLVVGGNTGGGNCFATGSGNGPNTARTFTFNSLDISTSNSSVRTLTFNWGNRYPACSGTGWDSGENLTFRAYHDGVPQTLITLATGNNNAQFSILTHSYSWTIPACVSEFYFIISVTTNRADELLFIDNVLLTAPQLNGPLTVSPISGNTTVCQGSTENYSVTPVTGVSYTWDGLPAGASFTSPNGTTASANMTIDWGTAVPSTYTLSLTPSSTGCGGGTGSPQTIVITITAPSVPVTISGPASMCPGETITLTSSYASGNTWMPNGETTPSISVTAPGTYTVSTATSCGTISATHTVTLNPVPAVQSVTPTPISCFGANDGVLTISSTDSVLEYSLDGTNWQASNVFSNLTPGTYTVQVRFVNGCSTTLAPVTFTEPAQVTANASNTGPYCEGSTVDLNGSTPFSGTTTYSWTGPNGFTSSLQNPTFTAQTGTHTYQLTVTVNGCQSTPATTTVNVNAVPTVNVSNTGPYCTGSPISLNSTTNSTGTITYSWTGPNGYTSTAANPSDALEAGMYELVISSNGCQSTSANTTVVINPIPTAQADYTAPFCTGTTLQLNGSTTSSGSVTYTWSGPNGYTSTLQNPADGTEAGTYTLVVTENGCTSTPATVNVISQVPFVSASNAGPYCEGTAIQLTGFTTASGTISYLWNGPNGYTSQVQNPADITEAGTYTLTVQEGNCSNSASTQVVVKPNPSASFVSSAPCMNDSMVFTSACSVPSPEIITNWHWDFNDGFTSSEEHPKHVFQTMGTHSVLLKVTTNSNCFATISKDVEVKPGIDANFYFSPSTISALDPTVHFVNSSINATAYTWNFGVDSAQSTEASPNFTFPAQPGSYAVELIATNDDGCIDSITKVITVQDEMTYYIPNAFTPDGDEFNQTFKPIFSSGFDPQNYTLLLFNRWGETIFESHDSETGWDGTYHGTMVPEGTYIWNIRVKQLHSDAFETFSGHVSLVR